MRSIIKFSVLIVLFILAGCSSDATDDQDEIILDLDAPEETLKEFAYNNNGAGAFIHEVEESEGDDKIGVSLFDDEHAKESSNEQESLMEEAVQFFSDPETREFYAEPF